MGLLLNLERRGKTTTPAAAVMMIAAAKRIAVYLPDQQNYQRN